MQYADSSIKGLCANAYCDKGTDGKRKEVPIRDTRGGGEYCGRSCASMARYKKRYQGTNAGPLNRDNIQNKMNKL